MRIFHQTAKKAFSLAILSLASSAALFAQPTLGTASPSPASGGGPTTFTISATDSGGAGSLTSLQMLINWSISGANACYVIYLPGQGLYLDTDQGALSGPPSTPGTGPNLSNGQCTLDVVHTTVTTVGTTVTMKPVITFDASFVGTMGVYGYASDTQGLATGFQQLSTYTTFTASSQLPSGSVSPNSGTGMSTVFTVTSTDVNGWKYVPYQQLLIGPNNNTLANSCAVLMYGAYGGLLYLMNDAYTAWQGPIYQNTPGTLSNNQCTIDSSKSTMNASGNNLTFNVSVSFKTAFAGTQKLYLNSTDQAGQSTGWLQKGTWTASTSPVSIGAGSPSQSSGGGPTTFTISASDAGGAGALTSVQMLINWSISGANACYVIYLPGQGLYLDTDQGALSGPPSTPGTGPNLSNGQCTLDVAHTTVTTVGNTITMKPVITFDASFVGTMGVYGYASDTQGLGTGFQQLSTYTTFAASSQLPSGTVTPSSGTGMSHVFTVSSTDVNGWKYMPYQQLLIGPNNSTLANSCAVLMYTSYGGLLYLMNDAYTAWQGPIYQNTPGTLHNNQCTIDSSSSTMSASGNNLTFNLSVTFAAGFVGNQKLYLNNTDQAGQSTGWLLKGTVPIGPPPSVNIDAPAQGASVYGTITVSGWAIDNTTSVGSAITGVVVQVDGGTVGTATYGVNRPDVCNVYPGRPGCPNVGFSYALNTATLAPGAHTITVLATDADGAPDTGSSSVTMTVGSADFTISSSAQNPQPGFAGTSVAYTVNTTAVSGFNGTETFSLPGLPAGFTGSFNPPTVAGAGSTQLTLNIPLGAAPGTTAFTIRGTSGSMVHDAGASVVIANSAPSALSVTPSSGTGMQQTFSFLSSDANGGMDIANLQLMFLSSVGNGYPNSCDFYIDRPTGRISLLQDDPTLSWGPSVAAGAAETRENNQCILNAAGSSITPSGIYLTVNLAITFKPAFAGTRNITMEVVDGGLYTGPVVRGTWTVGNPPPATVPVTLASVPSNLQLTVDGAPCTTPCQFQWIPQSSHPVSAGSPQSPTSGTRYLFTGWSDFQAQSHSIITPSSSSSYTATFSTQYFLTTTSTFGGTISPNSGWFDAGTPVYVSANVNTAGYSFTGFSGALNTTNNPGTLPMNSAANVTANFSTGLAITTPSPLTGGTTSVTYSQAFNAVGGTAPYTWSVGSGTPPGLTLTNGVLGGTPTTAGQYSFTVQATDSASQTTPKAFSLTISSPSQGDFSLSMTPNTQTVAPGGSAAYTVSVTGSGGFNGAVNLGTPTGLPSGATYSFSPSSSVTASQSTTLTIIAGSANGTSTITVNGTSGTLQHPASASLVVTSQPDFSLSMSPGSQTVVPGGSAAYTVSVTGSGGFNGTVNLAAPSGLPSGATYTFSPSSSATVSQPATLTITAGTATGTSTITVNGTSGALSHAASTSLVVNSQPDFNISLSPGSPQTVAPGNSLTYTVTVSGTGGFNSAVSLTAPSLPAGVTATFTPTAISPGQSATLLLSAAATGTTPGSYTLTVRGTSGALSHDTTGTYTISSPAGPTVKEYIRLGNRVIVIENH